HHPSSVPAGNESSTCIRGDIDCLPWSLNYEYGQTEPFGRRPNFDQVMRSRPATLPPNRLRKAEITSNARQARLSVLIRWPIVFDGSLPPSIRLLVSLLA